MLLRCGLGNTEDCFVKCVTALNNVGTCDGTADGMIVGRSVGDLLGSSVGDIEGNFVGSTVGASVGLDVGAALSGGAALGFAQAAAQIVDCILRKSQWLVMPHVSVLESHSQPSASAHRTSRACTRSSHATRQSDATLDFHVGPDHDETHENPCLSSHTLRAGTGVGTWVGNVVGACVGSCDGSSDGRSVVATDGESDGCSVGTCVGV